MRGTSMVLAAVAMTGAATLSPSTAQALASFTTVGTFGIEAGAVNVGGGVLGPAPITGQGTVRMSLSLDGPLTVTQVLPFTVSSSVQSFSGPTMSPIPDPSNPLVFSNIAVGDEFAVQVDVSGLAMPGGGYFGFEQVTINVVTTSTSDDDFVIPWATGLNFSGASTADNPGEEADAFVFLFRFDDGELITPVMQRGRRVASDGTVITNFGLSNQYWVTNASGGAGATDEFSMVFQVGGRAVTPAVEEVVPVPAALPLLATALVGMGVMVRRRRKAA